MIRAMSKLSEDPRIDPRLKALMGNWPVPRARDAASREEVLGRNSGEKAVAARDALQAEGIGTRVVSMPSVEWFEEQSPEYRASVLPPSVKARVAVEAGIGLTWYRYVGDAGRIVSLEHFGASADAGTLFAEFGFTPENVAATARAVLDSTTGPAALRG